MSLAKPGDAAAFRVADALTGREPWEVFGERIRRYEVHLAGDKIEMTRGPILLEGYGVRLFRRRGIATGVGYQSSNNFSPEGIQATADDADRIARIASFPTARVDLPAGHGAGGIVEVLDRGLWEYPVDSLDGYVGSLSEAFESHPHCAISFGSIRATLTETSICNSAGLRTGYGHTTVDLEVAVKSSGGAEGPEPGEYWVNETDRRLRSPETQERVDDWCRFAEDGRRGRPPATGETTVVLPPSVLAGILPEVVSGRLTGNARLRKVSPAPGTLLGAEIATLYDDGRIPWAPMSSPVDDEGVPQTRRTLIDRGRVSDLLYDSLSAGALDQRPTGNAFRGIVGSSRNWFRFLEPPSLAPATIALGPGSGGKVTELLEQAPDGIWVQQIGWSSPDPFTSAFGGEIRLGYRIQGGKLGEPVRGGTVGGVGFAPEGQPSLLTQLVAVGSEPEFSGAVFAPPVVVQSLKVGGES